VEIIIIARGYDAKCGRPQRERGLVKCGHPKTGGGIGKEVFFADVLYGLPLRL